MAASTLQKTQFITGARQAMTNFLEASATIRHYVELGTDLGVLSGAGILVDGDFINDNAGISAADFLAAGSAANTAVSSAARIAITKVKI